MIGLRRRHPVFRRRQFFLGKLGPVSSEAAMMTPAPGRVARPTRTPAVPLADIHWHGRAPFQPDFGPRSRHLAFSLDGRFTGRDGDPDYKADSDFYFAVNTSNEALTFEVPPSPTGRKWRRLLDTAAEPPADFIAEGDGRNRASRMHGPRRAIWPGRADSRGMTNATDPTQLDLAPMHLLSRSA